VQIRVRDFLARKPLSLNESSLEVLCLKVLPGATFLESIIFGGPAEKDLAALGTAETLVKAEILWLKMHDGDYRELI
jgi:hypothetical protein